MPGVHPPRAVIFDLDTALLDHRGAWRYAIEQSIATVCGRVVDARPLIHEYHRRPTAEAIAILVPDSGDRQSCLEVVAQISARSAIKHLLLFEGLAMALDRLRQGGIELGAISRRPHWLARQQIEATALDRFLAVLSTTPPGQEWAPESRLAQTLSFLGYCPNECVYVAGDGPGRECAAAAGWRTLSARWAEGEAESQQAPDAPVASLLALATGRP